MKKRIKGFPQILRDNWREVYDSKKERMPRGAQNLNTIITRARNENWRGLKEDIKGRNKKSDQ